MFGGRGEAPLLFTAAYQLIVQQSLEERTNPLVRSRRGAFRLGIVGVTRDSPQCGPCPVQTCGELAVE